MWKHIARVCLPIAALGSFVIWFCTDSIPATIVAADGYLVTNLKWLGWSSPPRALATKAADHWGVVLGAVLVGAVLIVGVLTLSGRWKGKAAKPATYISPKEAIRYLADETRWAWKMRKARVPGVVLGAPIAMRVNVRLEAPSEFQRQAAREGSALRIFGTRFGSADAKLLEHVFWMNNGFETTRLYSEAEDETTPTTWVQSEEKFGDLLVDRDGVLSTWPRLDPLRRWLLRLEQRREERTWRNV